MIDEVTQTKRDPCRVVLLGLPLSGKKEVAKILHEEYSCNIIDSVINPNEEISKPPYKVISDRCFKNYDKEAVLVVEKASVNLLKNLKNKNFISIVLVDAPFKKRFENYTKEKQTVSIEDYQNFSQVDQEYQNDEEYQQCLNYSRVRIMNNSTIDHLKNQISKHIDEILRPFRPAWNEYFMKIADIARRRSNCMKSAVGAVIVNDNHRVVSTGYNGTPQGLTSCYRGGCQRCNSGSNTALDECRCLHAEESAIMQAGVSRTAGCSLYTTMYPCFSCAKVIKQAGIKHIYYMDFYDKSDNGEKFIKRNYEDNQVQRIFLSNIYY